MYTRRVLTAFEICGQRSSIQKKHSRPSLISSAKVVWAFADINSTKNGLMTISIRFYIKLNNKEI